MFTHQNLFMGALKVITDDGLTAQDEVLVAVPLFHVAGLLCLTLPGLWAGATVTIHRQFDPGRVLADLQRHRVTRFMATPVMTRSLAASTYEPGCGAAWGAVIAGWLIGSSHARLRRVPASLVRRPRGSQ